MPNDPADRRSAPRYELVLKVEYQTASQLREDYLTDLSAGGLRLLTSIPMQVGQKLTLNLSFPGFTKPMAVEAEVRWKKPATQGDAEVGVSFQNLDSAVKQQIDGLLKQWEVGSSHPAAPHAAPKPESAPASDHPELRVVLFETNGAMRDIYAFELKKSAREMHVKGMEELNMACITDRAECLKVLEGKGCDVAIFDLDGLSPEELQMIDQVRNDARFGWLPFIAIGVSKSGFTSSPNSMFMKKPLPTGHLFRALRTILTFKQMAKVTAAKK